MVLRPKKYQEPELDTNGDSDENTLDEKPTGHAITTAKDSEDKN